MLPLILDPQGVSVCSMCNSRPMLRTEMVCFHSTVSLAVLWDGNKPRPSKHNQAPLTAECFSGGLTRTLSKQSADRLINRRACRGACCSIFSHPAKKCSFYFHGHLCADPVTEWVCHFIKIVALFECLSVKTYQICCTSVVLMSGEQTVTAEGNKVQSP